MGAINLGEAVGWDMVPVLYPGAVPFAPVTRAAYAEAGLGDAGPADGVSLDLHGAMGRRAPGGRRGRAAAAQVFITHDLRVAAQICDDMMVMQKGEVVEHGPAAGSSPIRPITYTRALIDAAPRRGWDFQSFREMTAA